MCGDYSPKGQGSQALAAAAAAGCKNGDFIEITFVFHLRSSSLQPCALGVVSQTSELMELIVGIDTA